MSMAMTIKQLGWMMIFIGTIIWSAIEPKDYLTWLLEAAPAIIGLILIIVTFKKFPLTGLLYLLILIHSVVLLVGAHYTYAEVPLFEYLKPVFGFERNNYDKLGHLMQGFMPAILAREILLRLSVVNGDSWRNFLIVSICLAFSALYELIEWWVALLSETAAEAFLGTQGYVWDTQSDMAFALLGAILALTLLSNQHDRQIARWIN
jgi:putative membrane protein